ncbi:MAG TPA: hypothetical protein VLS90_12450 [Thermodesulfobacteriota bacterium]|nr:hypothetical protein [Thermodesulfobacteriota bacterium]
MEDIKEGERLRHLNTGEIFQIKTVSRDFVTLISTLDTEKSIIISRTGLPHSFAREGENRFNASG